MTSSKLTATELSVVIKQMNQDGQTSSQIADALGHDERIVNALLSEKVELGSPEQILQESLRTVVSLIPIAEIEYRANPKQSTGQALTQLIQCGQGLITDLYILKNKEDVYRQILTKVLEPFCREMIKGMLLEVSSLKVNEGMAPITRDDLENLSRNVGKKFQETFRKSREDLGEALGVNAEARTRINLSTGSGSQ